MIKLQPTPNLIAKYHYLMIQSKSTPICIAQYTYLTIESQTTPIYFAKKPNLKRQLYSVNHIGHLCFERNTLFTPLKILNL